jgi:hypothetical protein
VAPGRDTCHAFMGFLACILTNWKVTRVTTGWVTRGTRVTSASYVARMTWRPYSQRGMDDVAVGGSLTVDESCFDTWLLTGQIIGCHVAQWRAATWHPGFGLLVLNQKLYAFAGLEPQTSIGDQEP